MNRHYSNISEAGIGDADEMQDFDWSEWIQDHHLRSANASPSPRFPSEPRPDTASSAPGDGLSRHPTVTARTSSDTPPLTPIVNLNRSVVLAEAGAAAAAQSRSRRLSEINSFAQELLHKRRVLSHEGEVGSFIGQVGRRNAPSLSDSSTTRDAREGAPRSVSSRSAPRPANLAPSRVTLPSSDRATAFTPLSTRAPRAATSATRSEGPFKCPHPSCTNVLGYVTKSDLNHHSRKHIPNAERPYGCGECPKHFLSPRELERHTLTHRASTFVCPACEKKFRRHDHRVRHMRGQHKGHPIPDPSDVLATFPTGPISTSASASPRVEPQTPSSQAMSSPLSYFSSFVETLPQAGPSRTVSHDPNLDPQLFEPMSPPESPTISRQVYRRYP